MRETESTIGRGTLREDLLEQQLVELSKTNLESNKIFKNAFVLNPQQEENNDQQLNQTLKVNKDSQL